MEKVIVAFESDKSCWRIKEILENTGTASCIVCRSGDQVKRAVSKLHVSTVVCGYKFADESAEGLFEDLPPTCAMLVVADLIASVRMLLQVGHRLERYVRPRRSEEEQAVIVQAKQVLMDRHGMTEAQAHRFLQKRGMDSGAKLIQTAQLVLEGA